jgi:hypothetical protein
MTRRRKAAGPAPSRGAGPGAAHASRTGQAATGAASRPGVGSAARRHGNPADMAPGERLAELGALLATGYRRLQLRRKALAESAEPEAPSDRPVDRSENSPEVA